MIAFSNVPGIQFKGYVNYDESTTANIIETANEYVKNNSKGFDYFLSLNKVSDKYPIVIFDAYPTKADMDSARVIVLIENGEPKVIGFGTSFPNLEQKYPELFRF